MSSGGRRGPLVLFNYEISNRGAWETALFSLTNVKSYTIETKTNNFYGYVGWSDSSIDSTSGVGYTFDSIGIIADHGAVKYAGETIERNMESSFNKIGDRCKISIQKINQGHQGGSHGSEHNADYNFIWTKMNDRNHKDSKVIIKKSKHEEINIQHPKVAISVLPDIIGNANIIRIVDVELYDDHH